MTVYATEPELASFIRIDDPDEDVEFGLLLETASRLVDSICGYPGDTFGPEDGSATARLFRARWCDQLYVTPFGSDTGLVVETKTSVNGDWDMWSATDYQLEPLNQAHAGINDYPYYRIRAVNGRSFPVADAALCRITAQWGFTSGTPEAIKTVTILIAKYLHEERNTLSGILVGEGFSQFASQALTPRIQMLLAPYMRADLKP